MARMPGFGAQLALTFCLALGVVLGGSLFGALGGLLTGYPARTMWRLAGELKPWAVVAAIGGDISTFGTSNRASSVGRFLTSGSRSSC